MESFEVSWFLNVMPVSDGYRSSNILSSWPQPVNATAARKIRVALTKTEMLLKVRIMVPVWLVNCDGYTRLSAGVKHLKTDNNPVP